jgi:hypothetical protein
MKRTCRVFQILTLFSIISAARADVADLSADWSNSNNPNMATFGSWSYRDGTSLLPEVSNWNGDNTAGFTQPAWAPSNNAGDFLPVELKAQSAVGDWQVGDVVVHTTDGANGVGNGPANFLWTSPNSGTVTIAGGVWGGVVVSGRDNMWTLFVNGIAVSSGTDIDSYTRANPFLFSDGTGGSAALVQQVTAGSTIDLEITRTSTLGSFVGASLTITEASAVPEPSSLVIGGLAATVLAMTALVRQIRKV